MSLAQDLQQRGFVHQFSGESLEAILDGEKRVFYLGVDPTATSLTIGNLASYMLARHLVDAGHTPILLVGGGTGMIGDPGGKSSERTLLDQAVLEENIISITAQVEKILGIDGVRVVNNADWLSQLNLIEFLRDVGKHFTVNSMIKKEIVKTRLDAESPMSYTEFTYSLLQAYDFAHLFRGYGCTLQIAGSDQWTNILAGIEYIRKTENKEVYGLTNPIIVNPKTGKKFGKSEEGALWLDSEQTSPYALYQYLRNIDDESVEQLLNIYTLRTIDGISALVAESQGSAGSRIAQKALARDVVSFVHGVPHADAAERVSDVLFSGDLGTLTPVERDMLISSAPHYKAQEGEQLIDVLVGSGLASSKREARQFLIEGAVSVSGKHVKEDAVIGVADFDGGLALMRRGKRNVCILMLG